MQAGVVARDLETKRWRLVLKLLCFLGVGLCSKKHLSLEQQQMFGYFELGGSLVLVLL